MLSTVMSSTFVDTGAVVQGTRIYARVPNALAGNTLELYVRYDERDEALNRDLDEVGVDRNRHVCFLAIEVVDGELELPRRSALFHDAGGLTVALEQLASARLVWAEAQKNQKWRLKGTWAALGAKLAKVEADEADPRVWCVHIAEPVLLGVESTSS